MSEVFFVLTVIYVAYVVYSVVDDEAVTASPKKPAAPIANKVTAAPVKAVATPNAASTKTVAADTIKPAPVNKTPEPVTTEAAPAPVPKVNNLAAPKIELRTVTMKNPETGELAKVSNNYRMVKRWIKEALVAEGLLNRVYKNTELNDDASKAKVAHALSVIKAMDKYQA